MKKGFIFLLFLSLSPFYFNTYFLQIIDWFEENIKEKDEKVDEIVQNILG